MGQQNLLSLGQSENSLQGGKGTEKASLLRGERQDCVLHQKAQAGERQEDWDEHAPDAQGHGTSLKQRLNLSNTNTPNILRIELRSFR